MSKDEKGKKKQSETDYFKLCQEFEVRKQQHDEFDNVYKKQFYKSIGKAFNKKDSSIQIMHPSKSDITYQIFKFQKTRVDYNLEEIKKEIDKEEYKAIIDREVQIIDLEGLMNYLKELKADKKKLKKYFTYTDKINEEKLGNELDLGKIEKEVITKNMNLTSYDPYYTLKRV